MSASFSFFGPYSSSHSRLHAFCRVLIPALLKRGGPISSRQSLGSGERKNKGAGVALIGSFVGSIYPSLEGYSLLIWFPFTSIVHQAGCTIHKTTYMKRIIKDFTLLEFLIPL